MRVEILMPELGESVHEGTVSKWLKNVGDAVKEDEPVVEIMPFGQPARDHPARERARRAEGPQRVRP